MLRISSKLRGPQILMLVVLITPSFASAAITLSDAEVTFAALSGTLQAQQPAPEYLVLPKSWEEGFRTAAQLTDRDHREYAACLMHSHDQRFEMSSLIQGTKHSVESGAVMASCNGVVVGTFHTHPRIEAETNSFYFPVPSDKDFAHFVVSSVPTAVVVSGDSVCVMVKGRGHLGQPASHQIDYGTRVFQANLDSSIKAPMASYYGLAQEAEALGAHLYCGDVGGKLPRILPRQLKPADGPFILAAKAFLIALNRTPGSTTPKPTFTFTPERDAEFLEYLKTAMNVRAQARVITQSDEKLYETVLLYAPDNVEDIGFGPNGFAYPDDRLYVDTIQFACASKKNGADYLCTLYQVKGTNQASPLNRIIAQYDSESNTSLNVEALGNDNYRATITAGHGLTTQSAPWKYVNGIWSLNGSGKFTTKDWTIEGTYAEGAMLGASVLTRTNGEVYRMVFRGDGTSEVTERLK
ncbi:hypothetical protein [Pseudomonas baetica]|uniref:hypothetical protein n=1 Tax=Pseudomonas baetica TaxID=674054 RepID=UPI0024072DBD|nr:hypothetical protein [Pseudomonas baetica]MDF9778770.1 hypothetical protein [Pseudomonas baetica]